VSSIEAWDDGTGGFCGNAMEVKIVATGVPRGWKQMSRDSRENVKEMPK